MKMDLRCLPYNEKYSAGVRELEEEIFQGRNIRLQIIKNHFLSRTTVFNCYYPAIVMNENDKIVGTAIGAKTEISVNGHRSGAGVVFDVKVHPSYRKKGLGKMMARYIDKHFFQQEGLSRNFLTLKSSNTAVMRLAKAIRKIWLYDFVYLTIPTSCRPEKKDFGKGKKQLFFATLYDGLNLHTSYYSILNNGLGYFNTCKMYSLKIRQIAPVLRFGLSIMTKLKPVKYSFKPEAGELFQFVTLFNANMQTLDTINGLLDELERNEIKYLMVCCRKDDVIYNAFKRQSINTYNYCLLADFPLSENDEISVDVRCL
jgi:GNAT superfamily N-acetyltransferase